MPQIRISVKDLAFYFFQCVNDRIQAKADVIEMYIVENSKEDKLELIIRDNGEKFDVGLMKTDNSVAMKKYPALYFLQQNCKENGGGFQMLSHNQTGNLIEVTYSLKNKERLPLGSVSVFLGMLFVTHPKIHLIYSQISQKGEFLFDSEQFKKAMGEIDFEGQEFLSNLTELIESKSTSIQGLA